VGLISVADLDARQVEYVDTAQAQAAIDDASAVARVCVSPVLDSVETPDAPATVVAVVVGMVRRVLANPRGLQSEVLGDYTYMAGTNAVATLLPTQREKRMLRQAAAVYAKANAMTVPAWGASAPYQQADLPAPPAFWDGIRLPSDDDV
jgi:N-acyl-L-homoserine lactone synthetase